MTAGANFSSSLQRFLDAQSNGFDAVIAELKRGHKVGHWMWYVFPQIQGLAHSATSKRFAIKNIEEAHAYLRHPVLGDRLRICVDIVNSVNGHTAEQIFGYPDYLKFRSSMTLFDFVEEGRNPFSQALRHYYNGEPDTRTLDILKEL